MDGAALIRLESILLLFPELSVCLFDATKPHAYDPERPGDEMLDLVHMCADDAEAEEKISAISEPIQGENADATGYMQAYAQAENSHESHDGYGNHSNRIREKDNDSSEID